MDCKQIFRQFRKLYTATLQEDRRTERALRRLLLVGKRVSVGGQIFMDGSPWDNAEQT
jgi:hypothetical protein